MSETKFNWDDLRLFLAVARAGGLAGAADSTEKSAATLGRRMIALERQLGLELFIRAARGYQLTASGRALLQTALTMESTVQPVLNNTGKPQRIVKISAGTWVTMFLCSRLNQLTEPDAFVLQFIASDQVLDISHREAVIGIRNQRPTSTSLAGRQLGEVHFAAYATSADVQDWVRVVATTPSALWVKQNGSTAAIEVTSPRNALDIALAGSAKVVLPTFVGNSLSALLQVSEIIPELSHQQWLVTHHDDRNLPEVRKVIDRVADLLCATHKQAPGV